ncbi:MAG: hypothetical protein IMZ64_06615 [Bacteroidetes bacterium]|nr:hypothetical protein [Bacteroidota bacterium]
MEPNKKIRVSVVVKYVSDKQDKDIINKESDGYLALDQLKRLISDFSKGDEEEKEDVLSLLRATRTSNEVVANALINVDRADLFEDKLQTIKNIDEIINQILSL